MWARLRQDVTRNRNECVTQLNRIGMVCELKRNGVTDMIYVYCASADEAAEVVAENKRLDNGAYTVGRGTDGVYEVRVIPEGNNSVYLGKDAEGLATYDNVKV